MNSIIIYAKKYFIINQIQRHLENTSDLHVYSLTPKLIENLTTRTIPGLITPDKLIAINWGTSNFPPQLQVISTIINHPDNIKFMKNKLLTLKLLSRINPNHIPYWTEDINIAKTWLPNRVFCRTLHSSSQGNGIIICEEAQTLPQAAFYTKDTQAKHEYRVHFSKQGIFLIQKKARKRGDPPTTTEHKKIKNHKHGWIFKTMLSTAEKDNIINALTHTLLTFLNETKLDFGAADVSYNEKHKKYSILEINSAPGITNSTTRAYATMFGKLIHKYYEDEYNRRSPYSEDIITSAERTLNNAITALNNITPEPVNVTIRTNEF